MTHDDMTPEDFEDDLIREIENAVEQANEWWKTKILCEQRLQSLVAKDLVEILVDREGKFHYRLTTAGLKSVEVNEKVVLPANREYFIDPWRLA